MLEDELLLEVLDQLAGPAAEPVEAVEAAEAELEAEPQEEVVVQVGGQVVPGLGLGLGRVGPEPELGRVGQEQQQEQD